MRRHHLCSDGTRTRLSVCSDGLAFTEGFGVGCVEHDGERSLPHGSESGTHPDGQKARIFNTDQGSQFTSSEWIDRLEGLGVRVSMDGKGRWMDNVFIERLWGSVKYEDIYLKGYGRISDLRKGLEKWFRRYNDWRPHEALGNQTPSAVYNNRSVGKSRKEAA